MVHCFDQSNVSGLKRWDNYFIEYKNPKQLSVLTYHKTQCVFGGSFFRIPCISCDDIIQGVDGDVNDNHEDDEDEYEDDDEDVPGQI